MIFAERGEHGSSVFMAITSVEELVKALIILMDGRGFALRNVVGIGVIFRNHQIRYLLSYAMFVINVASDE
jgi:AbiV family abortive infection protein